ncbi:MAG TPA: hypothetical protein VEL31_20615 [Ktedonobacteraceae bacterium]|nr:hypothetical protein [Ktedonobacteraceae bacterium]
MMESMTVGGLTFRWADNTLLITTPTGQHLLNGRAAADLLTFLDANRDEIFTAEQTGSVPEWAQPQASGQFVIGSVSSEQRQLPVGSRGQGRRRRSRRTTSL